MEKLYRRDLRVVVGRVVIDALVGVAAGGIDGKVVLAAFQYAAAAGHGYSVQNMEELTYALPLGIAGVGI